MRPEIINGLFALGGALIGVVGAWLVSKASKETQKITLFVSPCSKLLEVGDSAKSDVQITYRGASIKDLGAGEVAVQNTGTKALENIEIHISPNSSTPLLVLETSSTNFTAPDSFIDIQSESDGSYRIGIQYLNPNDRAVFYYRIASLKIPNVSVRKLGLGVEMKHEALSWIPDIYSEVIFRSFDRLPFPGYSWLLARLNKPYRLYRESKRNKA